MRVSLTTRVAFQPLKTVSKQNWLVNINPVNCVFSSVCVWHEMTSHSNVLSVLFSGGVCEKTGGLLVSALSAVPL